jgi:hypothetical protein
LIVLDNIIKYTKMTEQDNNVYLNYMDEQLQSTEYHTRCSEIYDDFKMWFISINPNKKIPSKMEFIRNVQKYKKIEKAKINESLILVIKNTGFNLK